MVNPEALNGTDQRLDRAAGCPCVRLRLSAAAALPTLCALSTVQGFAMPALVFKPQIRPAVGGGTA